MKVLGIYGSPRKGGNTDLLLDAALASAQAAGADIERIYCRKLKMSGCIECGGCDETGECVVKDDMQGVYGPLDQAEAVIIAAPIFFYNVPAQAKALIDRSQARWARRILEKPKSQWSTYDRGRGYLIAVGATKGQNLFLGTEHTAQYFYDALDKRYEGGMLVRGVEGKGEVTEAADLMAQAKALGEKAAGRG